MSYLSYFKSALEKRSAYMPPAGRNNCLAWWVHRSSEYEYDLGWDTEHQEFITQRGLGSYINMYKLILVPCTSVGNTIAKWVANFWNPTNMISYSLPYLWLLSNYWCTTAVNFINGWRAQNLIWRDCVHSNSYEPNFSKYGCRKGLVI